MIDETRIIAIDFDGTISLADWPDVGPAVPKAIETIKDLQSAGYRLILWTCRTGNHLTKAVSWLESQGVVMDSVNKNLQDVEDAFGPHGVKVYAGTYIDDKSFPHFNVHEVWDKIREHFLA
jgi:hydroxymethylpyrimidine pyrophosphatase-like HAD family hydrolase